MKIIEGLKKVKELTKKAEDLRSKIGKHSAYLSNENPVYPDQKKQVSTWIQSHSDILKEILRLRIAIQKTNLATLVSIDLGEGAVEKSIAEWVHRRRDLAAAEKTSWQMLTDRGLREGTIKQSTGEMVEVRITRCYEPLARDNKISLYDSEPMVIDSKLEVTNAITDLLE